MEKVYTETTDFEIKAAKEDRTITFIASKEVVDRDGDVVKVGGIDVKNYKKNPVVLWSHNYDALPIAKGTVRKTKDGELKLKAQFPTMEEYGFAHTVYTLLKQGYLNAVSVGFIPKENGIEYVENPKKGGPRRIFNDTELLEISVVNVPANQEALVEIRGIDKALEDGVIDEHEHKEFDMMTTEKKEIEMPEELKDELKNTEEVMAELTVPPVVRHDELAQKITETVVEEIIEEPVEEPAEEIEESYLKELLRGVRELKASQEQSKREADIIEALKNMKG